MGVTLKIKVCGMRDPENIKALAQLQPDFIGLIFYPKSPRYVTEDKAQPILEAIPDTIEKVGVFVNELIPEIIRLSEIFQIKTLQLHGKESPEYCSDLKALGYTIVKAFGINEAFRFEELQPYFDHCDYFLFDTKSKAHGGTGIKFNWQVLDNYKLDKPYFLSGGITADDAKTILDLQDNRIAVLDINSKFEKEPGLKDIELVKGFIEKIRM